MDHIKSLITSLKSELNTKIDARMPEKLITTMTESSKKSEKLEARLDDIEAKLQNINARMSEMIQHQRIQTDLLQHLLCYLYNANNKLDCRRGVEYNLQKFQPIFA